MNAEAANQKLLKEVKELKAKLSKAEADTLSWSRQLYALSKALHVGFWEWNEVTDKVIFYSDEMAKICGLGIDELYTRCRRMEDYYTLVHPDDLEEYRKYEGSVKERLEEYNDAQVYEYRIILPDGKHRYVRDLQFGVFNRDGDVLRSYGVLQDISEHRKMVDALEQSEERFSTLFDQLPLGVVEEDYRSVEKWVDKFKSEGIDDIREYLEPHPKIVKELAAGTSITNVNQALLDLNEASSKESFLAGEDGIDEWWSSTWVDFYVGEISALARGEKFVEAERIDSKIDGSYFETRSITTVVKGHEADWSRVITIHEDITSRKINESELVLAKNQSEKTSLAKSEFLSSMSHELRTPLNAILGFSQLFSYDKGLTENQLSNALEINRAGKHLLSLIDQVLDLSRIEAGEAEVSLEPVFLLDAIKDSLSWVEKLAESHQVQFHTDKLSMEGLLVNADIIRLKQILLNLFTNAVKYNKRGGDVFVEIENHGNGTIRIGVRDTGPGIGEDKLGELFQPFNRLGAEFSGTEGTGIGLVITQKLVALMKGKLEVKSELGVGTTFWIELELCELELAQLQCLEDITDITGLNGTTTAFRRSQPNILVAEDNVINRQLMAAQMVLLGYQADYAVDGAEALEMFQKGKYNLLITDIRMPVLNGYELMREIRAIDITGSHPVSIIAVTANVMQSDTDQCLQAGADDVIPKPVELDQLSRALKKWLPKETYDNNQKGQLSIDETQSGALIDLDVLGHSIGSSPETRQKLLNSFLDSLPESIADIEDAFSRRNHKSLADVAHKLKSSARSMGAVQLGDLCQLIELAAREKRWPDLDIKTPLLLAHIEQVAEEIRNMTQVNAITKVGTKQQVVGEDFSVLEDDISVLIVDDDFIMHRVTKTILNDMGIKKVHNAISGPKALDVLVNLPGNIDLVICDLNMPGMDGVEFMRHLASQQFSNSLILTSGEDIRILKTVEKLAIEHELNVLGVIQKPVTRARLYELLDNFGSTKTEGTMYKLNAVVLDELKHALDNGEIDVFFQPKVDLHSRQVSGAEVLVRWNHPSKGLIRPDAFIPMAEENQLINQLTNLVNGATDDAAARAILESSVLLAKKMEMKIVAEGVENQEDWDLLETLEVDEVQGYFIAKPMPFEEFVTWLKIWREGHGA